MDISSYIKGFYENIFYWENSHESKFPWEIINNLERSLQKGLGNIDLEKFTIQGKIAIHNTAIIEDYVVLKGAGIINEGCIIKSGSYLRDNYYLGKNVSIGPNCEIKQSIICNNSRIAHLNYVGNSILGIDVNMEGGSILANHFNEREEKEIGVLIEGQKIMTKNNKFGSLIGDSSRIGANSVLNPGTILKPKAIVERLTHIDQLKNWQS